MNLNRKTLSTWEFWSFVLVSLGGWLAELVGTLSGTQAVVLSAAAAGVMALSRGFAKQDADVKNWWETTEFFVAIIGAAQAVIAQLNGTISGQTMTYLGSGLAFALALSRGFAKNPLVAAGLSDVRVRDTPQAVVTETTGPHTGRDASKSPNK
jgi:hypothetical protein